jgi:Uma2 family endonuclease
MEDVFAAWRPLGFVDARKCAKKTLMQDKLRQAPPVRVVADAPTEPKAFLEWSSRQPEGFKYELSRGQVTEAMIWVTRAHLRICTNLVLELSRLLDPERYLIGSADFALQTPFGIRAPDVIVEPMTAELDQRISINPVFLAEVLSPASVAIDFAEKIPEYTAIPSLLAYLICSQDLPIVWLLARDSGTWPGKPEPIVGRNATVPLPGLGIEVSMATLYHGIPDPL